MGKCLVLLLPFLLLFSISGGYGKKKEDLSTILTKLKEKPSDPVLLGELGDIYVKQKKYNEAEELYKKCLSLAPEESRNYVRLARLYNTMDRPDIAKRIITNAAYYFDKNGEIFFTLGDIEYNLGNFSNALVAYEKALSFSDEKKKSYIYSGLGKTCRELRHYEKAKAFFNKSLQLKVNCWTYYEFGKLFIELSDYEKAIWAFSRAKAFSHSVESKLKKVIWEKLAEAYFKYAIRLKDSSGKEEAKAILLKITDDYDLSQTTYCEKASFWLKRL